MNRGPAIAIRQHRQTVQDGLWRMMAAVKDRSFGFGIRPLARFTLVALYSFGRLPKFTDGAMPDLGILWAVGVPTK